MQSKRMKDLPIHYFNELGERIRQITDTGGDITFSNYGGCTAVFNGINWKVFAKT